jgi:hypothetical protein
MTDQELEELKAALALAIYDADLTSLSGDPLGVLIHDSEWIDETLPLTAQIKQGRTACADIAKAVVESEAIRSLIARVEKAEGGWQTNVHYRIRFPAKAGTYSEFYSSNNGTSQWSDIAKVKAILTRGQPKGYKGRILEPFIDYEIIEVTERVESSSRPLPPPSPPES